MTVTTDDVDHASTTARTELLDAEQIAAELRVNVKRVRRWMSTHELRNVRVGRRRVSRRAWLEEFIDARERAEHDAR
jgi:hypothetical protein